MDQRILAIYDPKNELEDLFFAGEKAMIIFGLILATLFSLVPVIFFNWWLIGIGVFLVTLFLSSALPILTTRKKLEYFTNFLEYLDSRFKEYGIELTNSEIRQFVNMNKIRISDTRIIQSERRGDYYIVHSEEKIKPTPRSKMKKETHFTVDESAYENDIHDSIVEPPVKKHTHCGGQ